MKRLRQLELAESLDHSLGDPYEHGSILSFEYALEMDELETFPKAPLDWLYEHNLAENFVPEQLGGKFTSFEELAGLIRILSRRDLTTSISFSTLFWSFLTWMGGTDEQKRRLADYIMNQHGAMCLAYSEREHGSDLLNGGTVATRSSDGYLLSGEKWPINRATVAQLAFVLATTDREAGPRGLSLFMLEKKELDPSQFQHLPKIRTLGICGSDMSGIRFQSCKVSERSRIGREGMGLELALKGFQITRALCAAFSLGSADTALRTTLRFALDRELYGHRVIDLPHARRVLTEAFVDILICDCVTTAGMRGFHVVPEQYAVWSAVVKYFVPTTVESMIQRISVVLGARSYLREEHDLGTFQKVARDSAIISVFDGSTVVNLHALLLQLRFLAKFPVASIKERESRLEQIFCLDRPVSRFAPERLSLASRHADEVWHGLEVAQQRLRDMDGDPGIDATVHKSLTALTDDLANRLTEHLEAIKKLGFLSGHLHTPEQFEFARKYCMLHAAATCLEMWVWNRGSQGEFFSQGKWLVLALHKVLRDLGLVLDCTPAEEDYESVAQEMVRQLKENQLFSIAELNLA